MLQTVKPFHFTACTSDATFYFHAFIPYSNHSQLKTGAKSVLTTVIFFHCTHTLLHARHKWNNAPSRLLMGQSQVLVEYYQLVV